MSFTHWLKDRWDLVALGFVFIGIGLAEYFRYTKEAKQDDQLKHQLAFEREKECQTKAIH